MKQLQKKSNIGITLVEKITNFLHDYLPDSLSEDSIYLVGSLGRNEFVQGKSDVDLLYICRDIVSEEILISVGKVIDDLSDMIGTHIGTTFHSQSEIILLNGFLESKTLAYLYGINIGIYNVIKGSEIEVPRLNEIFFHLKLQSKYEMPHITFRIRRIIQGGGKNQYLLRKLIIRICKVRAVILEERVILENEKIEKTSIFQEFLLGCNVTKNEVTLSPKNIIKLINNINGAVFHNAAST